MSPHLYRHVPSTAVSLQTPSVRAHVRTVVATLYAQMRRHNFTCMAAVHIGEPIQVMVVAPNTTLINPVAVRTGSQLSKALETSLFYPKRPPKRVKRYVPVTVHNTSGTDTVFRGMRAHCLLNLLDEFTGTTIYDDDAAA